MCVERGVTMDGRAAGKVRVYRDGLYTVFDYRGPKADGVCRLTAVSPAGRLTIGVPAPAADGGLSLVKRLSMRDLGVIPDGSGASFILERADGSHGPPAQWRRADPDILKALAGRPEALAGALARRGAEKSLLALPFEPGKPFCLTEILCLGAPETINGKTYLVYETKDGYLL